MLLKSSKIDKYTCSWPNLILCNLKPRLWFFEFFSTCASYPIWITLMVAGIVKFDKIVPLESKQRGKNIEQREMLLNHNLRRFRQKLSHDTKQNSNNPIGLLKININVKCFCLYELIDWLLKFFPVKIKVGHPILLIRTNVSKATDYILKKLPFVWLMLGCYFRLLARTVSTLAVVVAAAAAAEVVAAAAGAAAVVVVVVAVVEKVGRRTMVSALSIRALPTRTSKKRGL